MRGAHHAKRNSPPLHFFGPPAWNPFVRLRPPHTCWVGRFCAQHSSSMGKYSRASIVRVYLQSTACESDHDMRPARKKRNAVMQDKGRLGLGARRPQARQGLRACLADTALGLCGAVFAPGPPKTGPVFPRVFELGPVLRRARLRLQHLTASALCCTAGELIGACFPQSVCPGRGQRVLVTGGPCSNAPGWGCSGEGGQQKTGNNAEGG